MANWTAFTFEQSDKIWDKLDKVALFKPYQKKDKVISLILPSIEFDTSKFFDDNYSEELYNDLNECAKIWFKTLSKNKEIIALDWKHVCYKFNPHDKFELNEFEEWFVPIFPNGDLCFFIINDFSDFIFCDGFDFKIKIFGDELIKIVNKHKPKMFG
jgi:hypothetical protein